MLYITNTLFSKRYNVSHKCAFWQYVSSDLSLTLLGPQQVLPLALFFLLLPHIPASILFPPSSITVVSNWPTSRTVTVRYPVIVAIVVYVCLVISRVTPSPIIPLSMWIPLSHSVTILKISLVIIPVPQAGVWTLASPWCFSIRIVLILVPWVAWLLFWLILTTREVITFLRLSYALFVYFRHQLGFFHGSIFTSSMSNVNHCCWLKSVASFRRTPDIRKES